MNLKELLVGVSYKGAPNLMLDISSVTNDTRNIHQNAVFVAIQGAVRDGHDFAQDAVARGAAVIVCERDLGLSNQLIVENSHSAYALMCGNLSGNPGRALRLIGVTGTNGKTTVANIIYCLLKNLGKRVGLISTIDIKMGDFSIPAKYTTPDPAQLHPLLFGMRQFGCEYVVIETSSHAFEQHRLDGLRFEVGVFNNLTQDHLDYHGTMERYFEAKSKLFQMSDIAVMNRDDVYGERLFQMLSEKEITRTGFSLQRKDVDFLASNVTYSASDVRFHVHHGEFEVSYQFGMPGKFSVENALAGIAVVAHLGFPLDEIACALKACRGVKGRTEVIETKADFTVMRDFAHAPDGLDGVLSTVRAFAPKRILTVFGCAGERDGRKRKAMGEAVAKYSDVSILTSDNPRREDEAEIIAQAEAGLKAYDKPYATFLDRLDAIKYGISLAEKDDILLLAGKGHEDYQVLAGRTIAFDERDIIELLLGKQVDV